MGLEEHLLTMFREDFEFHDGAGPSHLSKGAAPLPDVAAPAPAPITPEPVAAAPSGGLVVWTAEAEAELRKIPFFVRGKAKRNTETYAAARGIASITVETLYDAKSHFAR
jgi:light-independent protochlorophyllide reductase subunit B